MKIVDYKVWPRVFCKVLDGSKRFELRESRRGRDPKVGTILRLREWSRWSEKYTGREFLGTVTFVLSGAQFGITPGYIVFGFTEAPPEENASAFSIEADTAALSKAIESIALSVLNKASPSETKLAAKESARAAIRWISGDRPVKPEHMEYMITEVALRAAIMVSLDDSEGTSVELVSAERCPTCDTLLGRCCRCGKDATGFEVEPDPYQWATNDDKTPHLLCRDCHGKSADAI